MQRNYKPEAGFEKKWVEKWRETNIYKTPPLNQAGKKFYCLDMFPYPSGSGLHVGHVEGYTASDIYSRYMRMNGYSVLHPIGWDAFGLPAENYAIKTGVHPNITTDKAIENFKLQINNLGLSYDWAREIQTNKPEYYKWTQWFFLLLYKNGLAYKKQAKVNWCESCQTVLANEQSENGICERCGNKVIQKDLSQWFFKITDYIEDQKVGGKSLNGLLKGLDTVDWPESTKIAQRNWIGKSTGVEFELPIKDSEEKIIVYTTRIDTVFGLSYIAIAPEHELVNKLIVNNRAEVDAYVNSVKNKTDLERMETKEKNGVELAGIKVLNVFTNEFIPVFVADYVLNNYGTGAVMAVPAHDVRDFRFAKKYSLPIKTVIVSETTVNTAETDNETVMEDDGILINSGQFSGMKSASARSAIAGWIEKNSTGREKINYKLRDWLVSRQRYWGAPIPILYCEKCGETPIPEADLPVILPTDVDFKPTGESPLVHSKSFHSRKCPTCGGTARMESDTMDTFVCSSWYYFRYLDPNNSDAFAGKSEINKGMPVDLYIGGAEHSVLHLLYARFFTKILERYGYIEFNEPFLKLRHPGTILAEDGNKMSKSKGNVVNPDEVIQKYGADSLRLHEMFLSAFEDMKPWNTKAIVGVKRFLDKTFISAEKVVQDSELDIKNYEELLIGLNKSIKIVGEHIFDLKYNTAISQLMILVGIFGNFDQIPKSYFEYYLLILAPFAPFTAEELWAKIGNSYSIHQKPWPKYDSTKLGSSEIPLAVQINGKMKGLILITRDEEEILVLEKIMADAKLRVQLEHGYKKVIYIKNKIINILV